jgi:hypothetical protein
MGRVMSLFNLQFGLMSVFTFFAGVLAEKMPVQWVLGGMAAALIIFCLLSLVFFPRIRQLD